MFIFSRPLTAVAAGLGLALLVVVADGLCQCSLTPSAAATDAVAHGGVHDTLTCNAAGPCGIVRAGS